ncbi:MAG: hypothetical protein GY832_30890 [Chloroflexi bacterium]|nr:hypothetical protein [Chloroflexota bacterium]
MDSKLLFLIWAIAACGAAWIIGELLMRLPRIWRRTVKLYLRLVCGFARRTGRGILYVNGANWSWRGQHKIIRWERWYRVLHRCAYRVAQQMVWSKKSSYDAGWMDNCRNTMREKEYYRDRNRELLGRA